LGLQGKADTTATQYLARRASGDTPFGVTVFKLLENSGANHMEMACS
jgi:hypothetical protein